MKRLCFGSVAKILKQCKLAAVTDAQLIGALVKTIDPTSEYGSRDGSAVSRLLSCQQNLSNGSKKRSKQPEESNRLTNILHAAQKAKREDVSQAVATDVLPLLSEDRKALAALAILDVIREDEELNGSRHCSFEKYLGTTKEALLSQSHHILALLIAGILLYVVLSVENTEGKSCISEIDKEYVDQFVDKIGALTFSDVSDSADIEVIDPGDLYERLHIPEDMFLMPIDEGLDVMEGLCRGFLALRREQRELEAG